MQQLCISCKHSEAPILIVMLSFGIIQCSKHVIQIVGCFKLSEPIVISLYCIATYTQNLIN